MKVQNVSKEEARSKNKEQNFRKEIKNIKKIRKLPKKSTKPKTRNEQNKTYKYHVGHARWLQMM